MASTLLSPGVEIQERDLTIGSIETVEVNVGAIAGAFSKGPVLKPVRIANESQLIEQFGEPSDGNAETWWTAASFLQYGGVLDVVRVATSGQLTASDDNVTSPYTLSIPTDDVYEAVYASASSNPFRWAARNPGSESNAIKVAIIDKGADVTLSLDGALSTSTVGTQVQNTAGTKSGFIYQWDSVNNKVSLITSDTWDLTDVVENGVTDLNITAKSDWYDGQVAYGGVSWASIAPRPGTSPYVAERGGANDEMHVIVFDSTGVITGTPNTLLEKFTYLSKANDAKTQSGAVNYYPTVIQDRSQFVYWGSHENDAYDVSGNALITSGANFGGTGNAGNPSTTTFDLFSSDSSERSYTFVKGAESLGATSGEIMTGLTEFADVETLDVDYILMGPGDAGSKSNTQAIAAKVLSIASGRKDAVGFISPFRGDVVGVTSSATQTQNVVDFYTNLQATSFGVFDNG